MIVEWYYITEPISSPRCCKPGDLDLQAVKHAFEIDNKYLSNFLNTERTTETKNTERAEATKMDKKETLNFDTDEGRVKAHANILKELNDIYKKKNHDYGDSFHKTFIEEGFSMSRIRLSDKLERFKTLSHDPSMSEIKDESIRDTLMDLANYAVMTVLEMDRLEKK